MTERFIFGEHPVSLDSLRYTMGHCYVEKQGKFVGMVHCNSLHSILN
ncbi:MAG: hypothetical protein ACHQU0_03215 [Candidatus Paceibacteria bacterium]